jgi:hypothetical protein
MSIRKFGRPLLMCLALIVVAACGALPAFEPVTKQTRSVRPASDPARTVAVRDGMVWYANAMRDSGMRFPPGAYTLEAEDSDYWYFRSAAPLEFRKFSHGQPTEQQMSPGGLMLGKQSLQIVPAAAYIDGDGQTKVMVWKLGGDFLAMQGHQWRKSW